ncbi:MAG: 5-formyltetrahydrofolate cyclo-ligase [Pseudomonadota bacterium]
MLPTNKADLRQRVLDMRGGMDASLRSRAAQAVAGHAVLDVGARVVSAYHAIDHELDPARLVDTLADQGALLALPVLLDNETMVFRQWNRHKELVSVGFGTLGPDADQPQILPELIFAPLAAFSSAGQRIGYGKGHYDRAVAKMYRLGHRPAYVGLAFEEQEVPAFDAEPHDVMLDAVLTPSGVRIFDHGRERMEPFLRVGSAATDRR